MMRVVFCLPGHHYSGRFLECWSDLLASCLMKGVTPIMRREYCSNVYLVRNLLLQPHLLERGIPVGDVKVLEGAPYDYLMWIDSDAVFDPDKFWMLLKHDVDIVAGSAITNATEHRVSWGMLNEVGACDFAVKEKIADYPKNEKGLISVDFTGFHWVLIKKGVFEKMAYPWFQPVVKRRGKNIVFPGEDISWSALVKDAGFEIFVDPECRIGHEKSLVLVA